MDTFQLLRNREHRGYAISPDLTSCLNSITNNTPNTRNRFVDYQTTKQLHDTARGEINAADSKASSGNLSKLEKRPQIWSKWGLLSIPWIKAHQVSGLRL
jgi:hypothetical protein